MSGKVMWVTKENNVLPILKGKECEETNKQRKHSWILFFISRNELIFRKTATIQCARCAETKW